MDITAGAATLKKTAPAKPTARAFGATAVLSISPIWGEITSVTKNLTFSGYLTTYMNRQSPVALKDPPHIRGGKGAQHG
jgi:hypothetical protein